MKLNRKAWIPWSVGALAVFIGLQVSSTIALRNEQAKLEAEAATRHEQTLRLALWRMDSWLGPVLAREASRDHEEYSSYREPRRAFSAELHRLPSGSVLSPSALLGFESELLPLHFEWTEEHGLRSPQVPLDAERDLALRSGLDVAAIETAATRLQDFSVAFDPRRLDLREPLVDPMTGAPLLRQEVGPLTESERVERGRNMCAAPDTIVTEGQKPALSEAADGLDVGAFQAHWLPEPAGLIYLRQVGGERLVALQGFQVHWPTLRARLLQETEDLLPLARLEPAQGGAPEHARKLGAVPALLSAELPPLLANASWTSTRSQLVWAWIAGFVAVGAIGWSLHRAIAQAERRTRFATAVSHELRTPLTTFRLYSELLADGAITDPGEQQEYLDTLKTEAERLEGVVENVLVHARVQSGKAAGGTEALCGRELLERVSAGLRHRAERANVDLTIDTSQLTEERVDVNVGLIERVLVNLIDNACKYGTSAEATSIALTARCQESQLQIAVRDDGPGIPASQTESIFLPFERGALAPDDASPGVGLGLALSRDIARSLGGELSLDRNVAAGARFLLSLPLT